MMLKPKAFNKLLHAESGGIAATRMCYGVKNPKPKTEDISLSMVSHTNSLGLQVHPWLVRGGFST